MTTVLHNARVFTGRTMVERSAVIINDGVIEDVCSDHRLQQKELPGDTRRLNCRNRLIAPGFIDTHVHGTAGFGTEDMEEDSILAMSRHLVRYGVTSFCPTLYPMQEEDFLRAIRAAAGAMGREEGARILGLHLEGPFLSPEKAGVQKKELFLPVDLQRMKRYIAESGNTILNMTVAPELKNMRDLALFCTKAGIVLQAGHTNATYDNMVEGIEAGILHSTHFFNAMRPLNHRDPGVVGAILIHPEISCEIIADGYHVHPAIVKMLLSRKAPSRVALVTDALKTTGQTGGDLVANGEQVYYDGEMFRRAVDDVIAGSCLTMDQGVRNLVSWGIPLEDALVIASGGPAAILGRDDHIGSLIPGHQADLVVLATAGVANNGAEELAQKLHVSYDAYNFFAEAHPKLMPIETNTAGIFLAGACQSPKDIPESVSQASGAAGKVSALFGQRKELERDPMVAVVNRTAPPLFSTCMGCFLCESACPYHAIEKEEIRGRNGDLIKTVAKVNEGLCQGCGTCVALCKSKSIDLMGYSNQQMYAEIKAL